MTLIYIGFCFCFVVLRATSCVCVSYSFLIIVACLLSTYARSFSWANAGLPDACGLRGGRQRRESNFHLCVLKFIVRIFRTSFYFFHAILLWVSTHLRGLKSFYTLPGMQVSNSESIKATANKFGLVLV